MTKLSIFVRHPREGGYTFVTAPNFPGFSFMLEPGEDDISLNSTFLNYLAYDIAALSPRMEEMRVALKPFADFAEKAEAFVESRAKDGGSPILPSTDFRLADFHRARAALDALSLQDRAQPENFARVRAENDKLREALRTIQRTTFSGSQMSDEYVRGNRDAHTTCANIAGAALRAMVAEDPTKP